MKIAVDVVRLRAELQRIIVGLPNVVDEALVDASEQGAQIARTRIGYKPRGSNGLREKTVAYRASALVHGIIANTAYASWVEYGNGTPGTKIYPTNASCLHFFIDGKEVFAKWVKASAPHPFMVNAENFLRSDADRIVGQHITTFLQGT